MIAGALLVNGTSMSSLSSFFSLTSIATNMSTPLVLDNKGYGVVVTGTMYRFVRFKCRFTNAIT